MLLRSCACSKNVGSSRRLDAAHPGGVRKGALVSRSSSSLLLASATLLGIAGCSNPAPANTPIEDLGASYAGVTCQLIHDCYGDAVFTLLTGTTSIAECQTRAEQAYTNGALPRYEAAIAMGTMSYDGTQAQACIDALRAEGCDAASQRAPAACDALFVGTVAAGGACAINEECSGDSYCNTSAGCPGTCQARGGSGTTCVGDDACQSGLRCGHGTCQAPAGDGAACQGPNGVDCVGGFICIGSSTTAAGTCRAPTTVFAGTSGATCNVQMSQFCQAGLSCVVEGATMQTCQMDGVADGQPCHISLPDQCGSGSYCSDTNIGTGDLAGTCAPLPTSGACATVTFGARCADGFTCDATSTQCVEIQDNGGSCTSDGGCASGNCSGGICAAATYCPS